MRDESYSKKNETNLNDILRILWKGKFAIFIPSIILFFVTLVYYNIFYPKLLVVTRIETKSLDLIINNITNSNKTFSIIEFNKYIRPIIKKNILSEVPYSISIGDKDNIFQSSIRKGIIYNLSLKRNLRRKKNMVEFLKDIEHFFRILEKEFFREFIGVKLINRNLLEYKISGLKKKKNLLQRQIKAVEKYINRNEDGKNFIDANNYPYPFYLPPFQQFTGLNIEKSNVDITLADYADELNGIVYLQKFVKDNSIDYFSKLIKNKNIEKYSELYIQIKYITNGLNTMINNSKKNSYIDRNYSLSIKFILFLLFCYLFFMSFLLIVFNWWKQNRDHIVK